MPKLLTALVAVVLMMFALPSLAQTGGFVAGTAPGKAAFAQTAKVTATITAIDKSNREVTIKGPKGNEVTISAGPQVKNFAALNVGDKVNIEYIEALTLELKKGGGLIVQRSETAGLGGAKAGDQPAGAGARQVTVVADVVGLDAATQTVTLKGPQRTVDLRIPDAAQFKRIAKGDQVEATYTQALAIAVDPVAKP